MTQVSWQFWIPVTISVALAVWSYFQQKSLEQLKKNKEKQLLVHRLQFDKEFAIYQEIWENLVELRNLAVSLRPQVDSHDANKTYEEVIKERLSQTVLVGNKTIIIVEKNRPFYSSAIYDELQKLIKLIRTEISEVAHKDTSTKDYWERGKANSQELLLITDRVCEEIRKRIMSHEE